MRSAIAPAAAFPLRRHLTSAVVAVLLCGQFASGEELSSEACAKKLQQATLTVRIHLQADGKGAKDATPRESQQQADDNVEQLPLGKDASQQVTICSGVAVGEKLIISATYAAADSHIRVTLPGGEQTEARLRVLDEFSGLVLLEAVEGKLMPIEFDEAPLAAGAWILTAAGWGAEAPLVSSGVIGGVDRTMKGIVFPPLLQCDVRPTETACGSGLMNKQGKLVGIIVAADGPETPRGWVYAVPVSHVRRLLRARQESTRDDAVIVLKRRRPTVGAVLESNDAGVTVTRLVAGGAGEKAGLKPGDRIITAEGITVRSVYEAVRPTLYKQPGDVMSFTVQRGEEIKKLELVLGGGVELPGASNAVMRQLIQPKLDLGLPPRVSVPSQKPGMNDVLIRNYYSDVPPQNELKESAANKARGVEQSLERYRDTIGKQEAELDRREETERRQAEVIEMLEAELAAEKKKNGK